MQAKEVSYAMGTDPHGQVMCVVYGLNYLDKTTISYASVMGIKKVSISMGTIQQICLRHVLILIPAVGYWTCWQRLLAYSWV